MRNFPLTRSFPRRLVVNCLRAMEALAFQAAGRRWKIDRFNRLIDSDVRETAGKIASAGSTAIIGIPFHKEAGNIGALVQKLQENLQSRPHRTAIVIVAERKTKDLLFSLPLPPSTPSVTIVRLAKPLGFGQKPGLSRRSWSHWLILQIARQCGAHVVFIDADVRNPDGWVHRYLDAIQDQRATVVVADYVRQFDRDDAMVHIWDRLLFGALFRKWVAFRHGGDYAIAREFVSAIASDHSIMRERTYTLDSAVIARAVSAGQRVESVWLGSKQHEPISTSNLFKRLPDLVRSVFDDVASHLPRLLRFERAATVIESAGESVPGTRAQGLRAVPMCDLVGPDFRQDLHADIVARFAATASYLRRATGSTHFDVVAAQVAEPSPPDVRLPPRLWARLTLRFLMRYIRNPEQTVRNRLVQAYVPILELGVLGFLNETCEMHYEEALQHLERIYLPHFQQIWNGLSRRLPVYRWIVLRRWPKSVLSRFDPNKRRWLSEFHQL